MAETTSIGNQVPDTAQGEGQKNDDANTKTPEPKAPEQQKSSEQPKAEEKKSTNPSPEAEKPQVDKTAESGKGKKSKKPGEHTTETPREEHETNNTNTIPEDANPSTNAYNKKHKSDEKPTIRREHKTYTKTTYKQPTTKATRVRPTLRVPNTRKTKFPERKETAETKKEEKARPETRRERVRETQYERQDSQPSSTILNDIVNKVDKIQKQRLEQEKQERFARQDKQENRQNKKPNSQTNKTYSYEELEKVGIPDADPQKINQILFNAGFKAVSISDIIKRGTELAEKSTPEEQQMELNEFARLQKILTRDKQPSNSSYSSYSSNN